MNITNINPYQGLQNAISPGGNNSAANNRHVGSDAAAVYDPPFFPIATYQRQDLIHKVVLSGEEIAPPAVDQRAMTTADRPAVSADYVQPGSILTITI